MVSNPRTGKHDGANADYVGIMKPQLDISLKVAWQDAAESHIRDAVWVRANAGALSFFCDEADLAKIISTPVEDSGDVADELHRVVTQSSACKSMFKKRYLKALRVFFLRATSESLRKVVDARFSTDLIAEHMGCVRESTRQLIANGVKKFDKVKTKVGFFGKEMKIDVDSPETEADLHWYCLVTTIGVNTGQLPMMPYEACLFTEGCFDNVPRFLQIPDAKLGKIRAVREAAVDYLTSVEDGTLSSMVSELSKHAKALQKLNKGFKADLQFLVHHAEGMHLQQVQNAVLGCFPSSEHKITFAETGKKLVEFMQTPAFQACGVTMKKHLRTIEELVACLMGGTAHDYKPGEKHNSFFAMVLKRAEWYYTDEVREEWVEHGDKVFARVVEVRGPDALQARWGKVRNALDPNHSSAESITMAQMKPFKQFAWSLSVEQYNQVLAWIKMLKIESQKRPMLENADPAPGALSSASGLVVALTEDVPDGAPAKKPRSSCASGKNSAAAGDEKTNAMRVS